MTLALRTHAQRLLDRLDESECISPGNSERIRQRLEETDEVDAIVFECTLGGMPGSWDLALRVKTERLKAHLKPKNDDGGLSRDNPSAWVTCYLDGQDQVEVDGIEGPEVRTSDSALFEPCASDRCL